MSLLDKICVTGGNGFLGRHLVDELYRRGYNKVSVPSRHRYDLRTRDGILEMLLILDPHIIIHAAAHCGGIGLNKEKPAELFYDNALMGIQLMHEAWDTGVEKFVQLGTVCEYPKFAETPFREEYLWAGYPEETNASYGVAKKSLLVQGQAYRQQYGFNVIHLLPVNMYGPGDNFDPSSSHVIPALIRKFAEAKQSQIPKVEIWGTGQASREFLYVEDAAEAIISAMECYNSADPLNIGTGAEISIGNLVKMIADKIGYAGEIVFDVSKPDGQPRRCLDTRRAKQEFGFEAKTSLEKGLDKTLYWYYARKRKTR